MTGEMIQKQKGTKAKRILKGSIIALIVVLIYIWAFSGTPAPELQSSAWQVTKSILHGLFHPDWGYVYDPGGEDLLRKLLETLAIAILGTFISAIICFPFAFWASRNLSRTFLISASGKFILAFVRTVPELVMALVFIKAVGPGSFAGVLALGIHSIGMLGKLFSESIETMDFAPTEALTATGANKLQTFWFAVIPQVIPSFLSYTLYRFDINMRAATVLGVIGAGGIGTPLIFALQTRSWSRVGIILLGIIVMVTIIDYISGYIRKKIV